MARQYRYKACFITRLPRRRMLQFERLEGRTLLSISLNGFPEWHEEGPGPIVGSTFVAGMPESNNPQVGAIEAVAVDPDDADVMYIGSATGGIWRTTNATDVQPAWTPLTDQLRSLSIGAVALSPIDDNIVYAGIGRFSRVRSPESNAPGAGDRAPLTGILRSLDGGETWSQHGQALFADQSVRSIAAGVLLGTGQVVLAATVVGGLSGTFGGAVNGGLYRSVDFGATWTFISGSGGMPAGDVSDVIIDPANPHRFYAAIAGDFDANGDGIDNDAIPWSNTGIYQSNDDGLTWVPIDSGIPAATRNGAIRIELSAQNYPALGLQVIYAAIANSNQLLSIFRSSGGGANWVNWNFDLTNADRNVNLHFLSLLADRTDPRAVWLGTGRNAGPPGGGSVGVILRGADGANGFSYQRMILNNAGGSAPHEDGRDMVYDADGNILEVDDGGIYRLRNPSQTSRRWEAVNGDMRISEIYSITYDHIGNTIIGGTQDNGTAERRAEGEVAWDFVHSGDGNYVAVDLRDPDARLHYSSSQNLANFEYQIYDALNELVGEPVEIALAVNNTAPALTLHKQDSAGNLVFDATINQVMPYALNAVNRDRMLVGTRYLYESLDRGQTLTSLGGVNNLNADGLDNDNDGPADGADPEQDEFVVADWSNDGLDNDGNGIADGQDTNGDGVIDVPDANEPALGRITALVYGGFIGNNPLEFMAIVGTTSGVWMSSGETPQGVLPYPTKVATYPGASVRAVVVDPLDARWIYVADINGRIWHSRNFGGQWFDLTGNLAEMVTDLRSLELKVFRDGNGVAQERVLFAGGAGGVYRRRSAEFNQQRVWTRFGEGIPNVTVTDLHYDATDDVLFAATFGRGVWSVPDLSQYAAQPSVLNVVGEVSPLDDELRLVLNDYNPLILDVFFNNQGNIPTMSLPLASLEGLVFLGKEGRDHLIADFTHGETIPAGGLIFGGDTGIDRLTVIGSAEADRYTYRGQNIDTSADRIFNHSAENTFFEGRGGNDVFRIDSVLNQWTVTMNGGTGSDTFSLTTFEGDLSSIRGAVTLDGGYDGDVDDAGNAVTDRVTLYDNLYEFDADYRVTADSLSRSLIPDIHYAHIDLMDVSAGNGNNEFLIDGMPPLIAGAPVFLNLLGGDGNDVLRLSPTTHNLSLIQRDVYFNGQDGVDDVVIRDDANIFARTFDIDAETLSVNSLDLTYRQAESLTLHTGTNADTINVLGTGATTAINAGDGADIVQVGNRDLGTNIAHQLTIDGGDDQSDDSLRFFDQDSARAEGYTIDAESFTAASMARPATYRGFEDLVLSASLLDNMIDIDATAAGTPVTVNAGDGDDTFRVNAPPSSRLTLVGGAPAQAPGDSLILTGTGDSDGTYGPSAGTPGDGLILVEGQTIEFQGLEPVTVSRFGTFRLVTPNTNDELLIDSPLQGSHRISGTSGNVAFESLTFSDVDTLIVDMAANNGAAGLDHLLMNGGSLADSGVNSIEVIAAPVAGTLNVEGGTTTVKADGIRELHVSQSGTIVNTLESLKLESLFVGAGARVVFTPSVAPTPAPNVVKNLTIEASGTLDVGNNSLVLDYSGASPIASIRGSILSGRGGAGLGKGWTGMGITSSTVAQVNTGAPDSRSVGYAENALLPLGAYTTFRGQAIDDTAVLIAYTRTGDANLDGLVNDDDVTIIGATYAPGVPNTNWAMGDFDYNGFVDDDDVTLLGAFYQPAAALTLPSPGGRGVAAAPPAAAKDEVRISKDEMGAAERTKAGVVNAMFTSERATQDSSASAGPTDLTNQTLGAGPGPDGPGYPMPALRAYETFGLDGVRGQAFGELSRAETRAQQQAADFSLPSHRHGGSSTIGRGIWQIASARDEALGDSDALIDLLAETIAGEVAQRGETLGDARLAIGRTVREAHFFWPI